MNDTSAAGSSPVFSPLTKVSCATRAASLLLLGVRHQLGRGAGVQEEDGGERVDASPRQLALVVLEHRPHRLRLLRAARGHHDPLRGVDEGQGHRDGALARHVHAEHRRARLILERVGVRVDGTHVAVGAHAQEDEVEDGQAVDLVEHHDVVVALRQRSHLRLVRGSLLLHGSARIRLVHVGVGHANRADPGVHGELVALAVRDALVDEEKVNLGPVDPLRVLQTREGLGDGTAGYREGESAPLREARLGVLLHLRAEGLGELVLVVEGLDDELPVEELDVVGVDVLPVVVVVLSGEDGRGEYGGGSHRHAFCGLRHYPTGLERGRRGRRGAGRDATPGNDAGRDARDDGLGCNGEHIERCGARSRAEDCERNFLAFRPGLCFSVPMCSDVSAPGAPGRGMASRPLLRGACSRLVNAIENSGCRAYASSSASSRARGEARESTHVQDGDRSEGSRTSTSASSSQASSSQASSSSSTRELYPGHRPLTMLQKSLLSVAAGVGAVAFPHRADLVGAVGETTGWYALRRMRDRMRRDPTGRDILRRRPRITDDFLERCHALPEGTFGGAYARFMGRRKFNPDARPPVRFVDDEELAYVATRSREVHDLWHVLFRCPTTVQGELALKALEFAQTGLPMAALGAAFAPIRLDASRRRFLFEEMYPWARRAGARAADLMCLDYENEIGTDLAELRHKWRITPAPKQPKQPRADTDEDKDEST
mmetsp:Transcript_1286/g.5243  ORF Transcript_1286/g.5243 Transcript_1286/m.5243 type:complete len:716 (-) Transcript_1286:2890-5037(-)